MYRAGMASILSQLAREERLTVVEDFSVDAPKTKLLAQKVKDMGLDQVLVITDGWTRTSTSPRATCPMSWCSTCAMPTRCRWSVQTTCC